MHILFISNYFPQDLATNVHGIFQRMGILVEAIASAADTVDMAFFVPPKIDVSPASVAAYERQFRAKWGPKLQLHLIKHGVNPNFYSNWERYGAGVFDVTRQEGYFPTSGQAQVDAIAALLARRPDLVVAHRLVAMLPLLRASATLPPVVYDLDDIEHRSSLRRVWRQPRWPGERLTVLQVPVLRRAETKAINAADLTLVCSQSDQRYLQRISGCDRIVEVPNSVNLPPREAAPVRSPHLLFVGTFAYGPNVQGADFLVDEVWPLIIAQLPQAQLRIVGGGAKVLKRFHAPPAGVSYLGFVDDLGVIYRDTRLVCCPIFAGAGTRIKILEAGAYAKPVVATTIGAEGLELEDGREISIQDSAAAFARECVRLLKDDEACAQMGEAAYNKVVKKYSREQVLGAIAAQLTALGGAGAPAHAA